MRRLLQLIMPITGRAGFILYTGLGILSGLCSFLFINTVTGVLGQLIAEKFATPGKYLLIFGTIILCFIGLRKLLSVAIIKLSQRLFWDLRKQIVSLVLRSDYQQLAARKTEVHAAIVSDVNMLTQASQSIIDFFTATVLTVICFSYLCMLSWKLFIITLLTAVAGIFIYRLRAGVNIRNLQKARTLEDNFQGSFNSILHGFKELFMDPLKGKEIYDQQIVPVSEKSYENNSKAYIGFLNNQITGYTLFYTLIAAILIYLNTALQVEVQHTVTFVFTLLYLLGAINTIMVLMPVLVRAKVSANRLLDLRDQLQREYHAEIGGNTLLFKEELEQIAVQQLEYRYGGAQSFGIGPIDLDIQRGDVIFIYGGNGSGKSTFVHTLLGLLMPTDGVVSYNNIQVMPEMYSEYRKLFAVVFSDFYLFNSLLGIEAFNTEKWHFYLRLFELEGKVSIDSEGRFSTTELSTGQRKRLALIAALLEEKPVLVIDEWAADQDPYFRKKFYTEIIPLLKQQEITIIAITHDDRYYHCADKLFRMEYGKLIPVNDLSVVI